jgi:hypothetical protein
MRLEEGAEGYVEEDNMGRARDFRDLLQDKSHHYPLNVSFFLLLWEEGKLDLTW